MTDSILSERDRRKAIHLLRMIGDHERASAGEVSNAVSQLTKILKPYGFSFDKLIERPEILLGSGSENSTDYETNQLREMLRQRSSRLNILDNENQALRAENKYLKEELQRLLAEIRAKAEAEEAKKLLSGRPALRKVLDAVNLENGSVGKVLKWGVYAFLGPVGAAIKSKIYGTKYPIMPHDQGEGLVRYGCITILSAAFWGATYYADQQALEKRLEAQAVAMLKYDGCTLNSAATDSERKNQRLYNQMWNICQPRPLAKEQSPLFRIESKPRMLIELWLRAQDAPNCIESRYTITTPIDTREASQYNSIKNGITCS